MTPLAWTAFVAAAAVAAPVRYLVDGYVQDRTAGVFPRGTFVVNVTGSLMLGVVTGLGLHHGLSPTTRVMIGAGFLGSYTTFSTFTFETVRLLEEGAVSEALHSAATTLLTGAVAAAAGLALVAAI